MPDLPPQLMAKYTLSPLVKDGRQCLACHDVEGMEWAVLEWVEFYYGGAPWQRITRKSDDIFTLVENDIVNWPALKCVTGARFRLRLRGDRRVRRVTVRPCIRILGSRDGARLVMEDWLVRRNFMEVARGEGKSVE